MADVAVTNTTAGLSGKSLTLNDGDGTITGLHTFNRGSGSAPFAVNAGAAVVTNLDADKVDGYQASQLAVLAENETVAGAWNHTANLYVNDTANTFMGLGLTVNQGSNDDEAIALKSSSVAHGITDVAETDTYARLRKAVGASGGLLASGLTEATAAVVVQGICTAADTTKTTAGVGAINLDGYLKSGTTVASLGANTNILCVRDNTTTRFILDADGDSHQDVGTAWTNFDEFDDLALLTALSVAVSQPDDPLRAGFGAYLEQHRDALERARLVTFSEDGHHFVNMSRLSMVLVGAIRQIGAHVVRLREPWYRRAWRWVTGARLALPA